MKRTLLITAIVPTVLLASALTMLSVNAQGHSSSPGWLKHHHVRPDADADANADTNTDTNTNADPDPGANPHAHGRATQLLACLRHRDGERRGWFNHRQRDGALYQWARQ
jgi:hypothetical protein